MDGSYFAQLPNETKDIILAILDDKSKRMLRSASVYWGTKINYSHFTIYFAHSTMLPDLIQTFQRYSKPIGLRFEKTKELGPSYTTLGVLKNLTSLEVDSKRMVGLQFLDFKVDELTRFATLTNLQHFQFSVYASNRTLQHLTNVTFLGVNHLKPGESMTGLTNLGHLVYNTGNDADHFIAELGNPAALTVLEVRGLTAVNFSPESIAKVSNLSKLLFLTQQCFVPHSKLPKLESLELRCENFDNFSSSTKLTFLLLHATQAHGYQQLAALTNLRSLSLQLPITDEHYTFLRSLTNLERFETINRGEQVVTGEYLQFINSSKLTSITCFSATMMFQYAFHLTNLVDCTFAARFPDVPFTFQLTRVTSLRSNATFPAQCFPNLKRLTIMRTSQPVITITALTSLQYLESLSLYPINAETQQLLAGMTALTELSATYLKEEYNFEILQRLTALKVLQLQSRGEIIYNGIPQALLMMPNLEKLQIFGMTDDDSLEVLAGLTRLSSLKMDSLEASTIDEQKFSRLTNLQILALGPIGRHGTSHNLNLPYLYDFRRNLDK